MANAKAVTRPTHQLVRVLQPALREMVLSTLEAYAVRRGKKRKRKHEGVEIYGQIWGHHQVRGHIVVYTVESVSISSTSVGKNGEVDPNVRALRLKKLLMEQWNPQLMLLGDFHSHPYRDLAEVLQPDEDEPDDKGFEFSDDDVDTFKDDDMIWASACDRPLMLVMTICRVKPGDETREPNLPANVQAFTIGKYRFWLNGAAGYLGKKTKRKVTRDRASTLTMDLFPTAPNPARDRLLEESLADG